MSEEGAQTGSDSRFLRVLNCMDVVPPALRWLLVVLICFPAANFILMLTSGVAMEAHWQSGTWAGCGDAVLVRYFWLSWLIFLPVIPAVRMPKLRGPVIGLLVIWSFANFVLPYWYIGVIEWSCGPIPWLF